MEITNSLTENDNYQGSQYNQVLKKLDILSSNYIEKINIGRQAIIDKLIENKDWDGYAGFCRLSEIPEHILSKCTVYFDYDGGTGEYTEKEVRKNSQIETLPEAIKSNNVHIGWYLSDGSQVLSSYVVTSNVTIYARYIPSVHELEVVGNTVVVDGNRVATGFSSNGYIRPKQNSGYKLPCCIGMELVLYVKDKWNGYNENTLFYSSHNTDNNGLIIRYDKSKGEVEDVYQFKYRTVSGQYKDGYPSEYWGMPEYYIWIKINRNQDGTYTSYISKWTNQTEHPLVWDTDCEGITSISGLFDYIFGSRGPNTPDNQCWGGEIYFNKSYIQVNNQKVTFQIESNICTVTFDANGGKSTENSRTVIKNNKIGPLPTISHDNPDMIFNGWWIGYSQQVTEDTIITSDCTIRAEWDYQPGYYTIIFNGNGNTSGSMNNQQVTRHETTTINKNEYTKDGYDFTDWIGSDGNKYTDEQAIKDIAEKNQTITLCAQWESTIPDYYDSELCGLQDISVYQEVNMKQGLYHVVAVGRGGGGGRTSTGEYGIQGSFGGGSGAFVSGDMYLSVNTTLSCCVGNVARTPETVILGFNGEKAKYGIQVVVDNGSNGSFETYTATGGDPGYGSQCITIGLSNSYKKSGNVGGASNNTISANGGNYAIRSYRYGGGQISGASSYGPTKGTGYPPRYGYIKIWKYST